MEVYGKLDKNLAVQIIFVIPARQSQLWHNLAVFDQSSPFKGPSLTLDGGTTIMCVLRTSLFLPLVKYLFPNVLAKGYCL